MRTQRWNTVAPRLAMVTLGLLVMLAAPSATAGLTAGAPAPVAAAGVPVRVWLTTPDRTRLLAPGADLAFQPDGAYNPLTIYIDESTHYQEMDGFGATFGDSTAWLLQNWMSPAQRDAVMARLFDDTAGIGISFLRQPMGASDASASGLYTYDDMPAGQVDPDQRQFSIDHDVPSIIPLLQQAQQINPALRFMATPWSPPAWMKSGSTLVGGPVGGSLLPRYYGAYATYFVRFLQAYRDVGLPISLISVQNEPEHRTNDYPGMLMTAAEEATFIKTALGPALRAAGLDTRILIYDDQWRDELTLRPTVYPQQILSDADAAAYVAGTAFHWYIGDSSMTTALHNAFPDKGIYQTEASNFTIPSATFAASLKSDTRKLTINAVRNGSKTIVRWNIAFDTAGGPRAGGCPNCRPLVVIDQATGNAEYTVDYFTLGHVSKFAKPGARRIELNTYGDGSIEDVAFANPDGSKVVVALNSSTISRTLKVAWGADAFSYTLPAGALATFTWSGTPNPVTGPVHGLVGAYFGTVDLTGAGVTRIDPAINFNWGTNAPIDGLPNERFSVRWTGWLVPRYSQPYTISAATDDGVRVRIGGQLVIDNWVNQPTRTVSGKINLVAGTRYPITMEYFDAVNVSVAQLRWSSASQAPEIIPATQLYPS